MDNIMKIRGQDRELIPFSITFVTADLKKNSGGQRLTFDDAIFVGGPSSKSSVRDANHYENYTRNIRHRNSDRITKVHLLLVLKFNGMTVTQ